MGGVSLVQCVMSVAKVPSPAVFSSGLSHSVTEGMQIIQQESPGLSSSSRRVYEEDEEQEDQRFSSR